MNNNLNRKVLCSVLAVGLCGTVNFALAANSGGESKVVNEEQLAYVGSNGTGSNNNVYFDTNTGEQYKFIIGGYVNSSGNANYNSVTVNDITFDEVIIGGYVNGSGNANYNKVTVNNSTVNKSVIGGFTTGDKSQASNNVVIINNSTVSGDIYGGQNFHGGFGSTNNNSIVINNSTIVPSDSSLHGIVAGFCPVGEASNNSITIAGDSVLKEISLYGKFAQGVFEPDGSGNKLILSGFSGGDKTVKSLNYFDSIEVKALDKNENYTVGGTTTVIKTTDGIEKSFVGEASQTALIGVAKEAEGTVKIDGNDVKFTIGDIRASKQTASTTESRAGAAAFVNQGAEIVTDSLDMLSREEEGINTIAIVSGNNSKYKTGSYIDINGWNNLIGIANTKEIGNDKLNYSAFFENGSGNYNTFNDFDGNALRGDGNVVYNGGGMAVRFDKENGFYTEAAVRAGSVKNEVSNALSNGSSTYGYETDNTYYGGHIGIGKTFKLENGKAWDIYGKYFYMHYEDDSIMIAGDRFDFDSVDSNKLRIGARFSEQQGEKLTSYYGLAWDYEFSGDVSGTAAGYDMHSPSLEGSTVIGEVGFRYTPGKESPWSFDAKLRGYVGQQEGISGNVQAVYSF